MLCTLVYRTFNVRVSFECSSAGIMVFACINILAYISNIALMQWVGMNLFGEDLVSRIFKLALMAP